MGKKWIVMLGLVASLQVSAAPQQIIIVRHGEKPELSHQSTALQADVLSSRGYVRAYALAPYFINTFGQPDYVFAQQPDGSDESLRPLETCTPTAQTIKMPWGDYAKVNVDYSMNAFKDLANHLLSDSRYDGKRVVICWEHHHINSLAQALGVKEVLAKWPDNVFDVSDVLTYKDGSLTSFERLPQQLLYGDTQNVPF